MRGFFRRYTNRPHLEGFRYTQANLYKHQFQINLRNHRKIIVVDGVTGFTGGMNFYEVYQQRGHTPHTHDYHFCVTGPIVLELQYCFLRDWYYMTEAAADRELLQPAQSDCVTACRQVISMASPYEKKR